MNVLEFSMSGAPRGQGRPRTAVRGRFATIYKDAKSRVYENSVKALAQKAMGDHAPFEGALSASFRFRMPIPKSATKRVKAAMAAGEIAPTTRPDNSNLVKAIEDALNGVAYRDDCQIVRTFITKVYSERPGVDVRVEPLEPQQVAA